MNTNSNVYTIIYTTLIVVLVSAVLAIVASVLKPMQTANVKAETLSQMMLAANINTSEELAALSNDQKLTLYSENIAEAFTVNRAGEKVADLNTEKNNIELIDNLKAQDVAIKNNGDITLPVYKFKSGVTVLPVYGAGLWGPIWGYVALAEDLRTITGVCFDHSGETPGLGSKIKDDPEFGAQFIGRELDMTTPYDALSIVKGGVPAGVNDMVDAITGATMTCKGLDVGMDIWFGAYSNYLINNVVSEEE